MTETAKSRCQALFLPLLLVMVVMACAPAVAVPNIGGKAPNITATPPSTPVSRSICSDMDIRNRPSQLERLRGCVVVEGNLSLVLMDNVQAADFAPYSFPDLREVTGHVLFVKVSGLQSLGQLFPNLTLVRGTQLIANLYSFAVYQMPDLVELGLSSLQLVQRGAVYIDGNPMLCHADTLDWDALAPSGGTANHVSHNRPAGECEPCRCATGRCWGPATCRRSPTGAPRAPSGVACHRNCVIGCNGTSALDCVACVGPLEGHECVDRCYPGRLLFQRRRCVSVDWCEQHHSAGADGVEHQGECIVECPEGTLRDVRVEKSEGKKKLKATAVAADKESKEKGKLKEFCKPCVGPCRTECPGAAIRTPRDALTLLKGCTVINGTLEIEIPHGGEEVEKALEPALGNIEVITGSLVVSRSRPLSSLRFLRSLREVRGLDRNKKLTVFINDNDNLQSLFDWDEKSRSKTLAIGSHAQVTFYYNPRLCPGEIDKFAQWTNLTKGQMINNFNGFNNPCGKWKLESTATVLGSESVVLSWRALQPAGEVLAYAVYVTRAVRQNVTEYAGSIFCRYQPSDGDLDDGSLFGWMVIDVGFREDDLEVSTLVPRLQPASLYAYYIKTYTVKANVNSPIRYFRTIPDRPWPPSAVRATAVRPSAGSLLVTWSPPARTNGVLSHYIVTGELRDDDDQRQIGDRDFCADPATEDVPAALSRDQALDWLRGEAFATNSSCCCSDCCHVPLGEEQCERLLKGANDVRDACGLHVSNMSLERCSHVLYNIVAENMNEAASSYFPKGPWNFWNRPGGGQGGPGRNLSEVWDRESRKRRFVRIESGMARGSLVETLVPFGLYTVSVYACGRGEGVDGDVPLTDFCSAASVTAARSLPAADEDRVAGANASLHGDVLLVSWAEPPRPNGMLVSYHVRYRDRDKLESDEKCVTRQSHRQHKGPVSLRLRSGASLGDQSPAGALASAVSERFVVQVRVVSLAGSGPWVDALIHASPEGAPVDATGAGGNGSAGAGLRSTAKTVVAVLLLLLGLLAVALFYLRRRAARDSLGDDPGRRRLVSSDLTECWDLPDLADEPDHWPPNVHFDSDANRVSFEPLPSSPRVLQGMQSSERDGPRQDQDGEPRPTQQVYPALPFQDAAESTLPSAPPLQQFARWHLSNPFHPDYNRYSATCSGGAGDSHAERVASNPFSSEQEFLGLTPQDEPPEGGYLRRATGVAFIESEFPFNEAYAQKEGENNCSMKDKVGNSKTPSPLDRNSIHSDYDDKGEIGMKSQANEGMHKSTSTDSFTSVNLSDSENDLSQLLSYNSGDK